MMRSWVPSPPETGDAKRSQIDTVREIRIELPSGNRGDVTSSSEESGLALLEFDPGDRLSSQVDCTGASDESLNEEPCAATIDLLNDEGISPRMHSSNR